ncbi:rhombosortase [Cellvibrio fibrivorans]|uniref:Rhomboid family GlyGly-CTERM serine protease n=1 Tax=Cellvibrio fibrivorans TaxID=126350 RepID=A0ABU1V323_9GAMM|nr:rhombosortase [Cellvibrio fibrivorans]MDR7091861.1 rhomboid family GlyGly-CTERM serine protease [Cellvibrio fibrivorans]
MQINNPRIIHAGDYLSYLSPTIKQVESTTVCTKLRSESKIHFDSFTTAHLMPIIKITVTFRLCLILSTIMLCLTALANPLFPLLNLEATKVSTGEFWRLLTANLVHFGWAHTLMNVAALLLCALAFFTEYSLKKFSLLLLWCCAIVGVGIYCFNPEYSPYAGLSGAIHGLIVAGLLQTRAYPQWIRVIALGLVVAKLVQENSADYEATDLQALLPVVVAVESHLYGAIAGLAFSAIDWLLQRLKRKA